MIVVAIGTIIIAEAVPDMKSPFLHGDRNEKSSDQEEYDLVPIFCCNFPTSSAPRKGKRIIGSSDVAGMGIASVNHQHAIQTVLAPYYPIMYNIRNLQISNQTKNLKNY